MDILASSDLIDYDYELLSNHTGDVHIIKNRIQCKYAVGKSTYI